MKLDSYCVSRFYQKDEAAVNQVYAATSRLLRHVAYDVLLDLDLAQDAMMEAYVRALYSSSPLRDPKAFTAYLCATAKNAAIDMKRKMKEEVTLEEEAQGQAESFSDNALLPKLREILGYPDYDILVLHVVEGYSLKDIAFYLDLGTPASVRARYARAKEKAKEILGKEGY